MRRTRFFLAGILSLCLVAGYAMTGCGNDEGTVVIIDVQQLCAQSLQAMNSQGCIDTAYAGVDDLKDCFVDCGPADDACLNENCFNLPGADFSECSGDVEFLFSGQCGSCYTDCSFDFVGEASDPRCLFEQSPTGTQCLNTLYNCVGQCAE